MPFFSIITTPNDQKTQKKILKKMTISSVFITLHNFQFSTFQKQLFLAQGYQPYRKLQKAGNEPKKGVQKK